MAFVRLALGFLVVALLGVVDFLWVPRRLGSSKEKLSTKTCLLGGFIPAWAGQPYYVFGLLYPTEVYPRVGGATYFPCHTDLSWVGLSPRGRGNPGVVAFAEGMSGSIPAWAGQPAVRGLARGSDEVYPRVGGATRPSPVHDPLGQGLSPRGRGNQIEVLQTGRIWRSIPAWAGQPDRSPANREDLAVYPRVGGATW